MRPVWLDPVGALVVSTVIAVAAVKLIIKAIAALRGADLDFDVVTQFARTHFTALQFTGVAPN
ncbi:hypothetical protein [Arthrobacter sp. M4]|uniref:hypothetical protein n=1 Tax=Arthrobacter sp. M4 TaxID=218160 RepID=UPI001CDC8BC0|nr:hypothetical protein [Arthrobacter sp. M4]MCA4132606.1 hypothetical protein [Arthrobacter sp. M4]